MNWMDFLIGLCLMNAMPHFILGVWKGKMLSGFGVGNTQNIVWGLFNFVISIGLFIFKYGFNGLVENQIYSGAVFILITFFITSAFWHRYFYK
ncbi:MAG: hypothetical protein V4635_03770 [Bacteroidota bacterium]